MDAKNITWMLLNAKEEANKKPNLNFLSKHELNKIDFGTFTQVRTESEHFYIKVISRNGSDLIGVIDTHLTYETTMRFDIRYNQMVLYSTEHVFLIPK